MSGFPTMPKDARKAVKAVLREGWTLEKGGKHTKLRTPDGHCIAISQSASDVYAARHIIKDIERARERIASNGR